MFLKFRMVYFGHIIFFLLSSSFKIGPTTLPTKFLVFLSQKKAKIKNDINKNQIRQTY